MPINASNRSIILASGSPRRRRLLERLGFEPEVAVPEIPENKRPEETASDYTARLAEQKVDDVVEKKSLESSRPAWLVAADTVVVFEGEILEKPEDADRARDMLMRLSGSTHAVISSFCVRDKRGTYRTVETAETTIFFRQLDRSLIDRYVATSRPMDKSGGYGIQDICGVFVEAIRGSFFNVVGLPISRLVTILREIGALEQFPFDSRS